MKINIYSLVIEVGRKCNMNPPCQHCLRGYPQNKVISEKVLEKFFSQVNYISSITIGGGEPTLHLDEIDNLINIILKHNVEIGSFYIVTNGKIYRQRLIDICNFLYNDICWDNELSGLAVSDDKFHRERHKNIDKFLYNKNRYYFEDKYQEEMRPYARDKDKESDFAKVPIINMGMAKINKIGNKELNIYLPYKETWNDQIWVSDTELYLTYDGRLLPCCDLSYNIIDSNKYTIGNIMAEDLLTIVQRLPEEDDEHDFEKFWKGEN